MLLTPESVEEDAFTYAQKLPEMADGATVLTFCYDTGERYLSIDGLFPV